MFITRLHLRFRGIFGQEPSCFFFHYRRVEGRGGGGEAVGEGQSRGGDRVFVG